MPPFCLRNYQMEIISILIYGGDIIKQYSPIALTRSKSYGSNYYIAYSVKLQRNVTMYSQLEYHNFLTIEMDSTIKSFCEQPLEIELEIEGKLEKSIFDMWLLHANGREEFQEVKYQKELNGNGKNTLRTARQIQNQSTWCKSHQYLYAVRTDDDIYLGPYYINNLRYLHGILVRNNYYLCQKSIQDIKLFLKNEKYKLLEITQAIHQPVQVLLAAIAFGIYNGVFASNLESIAFSMDTFIWNRN